ncbi:hypothetical protein BVRB_1g013470 [Beta vulgaris subsp. vulgaris]|nr:hypothetical protein BVRB_1g013470 [Beta vulgaris subsp. vulgaris]
MIGSRSLRNFSHEHSVLASYSARLPAPSVELQKLVLSVGEKQLACNHLSLAVLNLFRTHSTCILNLDKRTSAVVENTSFRTVKQLDIHAGCRYVYLKQVKIVRCFSYVSKVVCLLIYRLTLLYRFLQL